VYLFLRYKRYNSLLLSKKTDKLELMLELELELQCTLPF
jgi:hypothetical protein